MDDYLQRAASNISRKDQELLRKIEQPNITVGALLKKQRIA